MLMSIWIHNLVSAERLIRIRSILEKASFEAGVTTAVGGAAEIKNNLQLPQESEASTQANRILLAALGEDRTFQSAAQMAAMTSPCFCRYEPGMAYGNHVDSPLMGGAPPLRTDISITVCLSDPESYDGGELLIDTAGVVERWKGNAGDAVLYPSDTLHRVEPVRRGTRSVAIFWIQSLVRDWNKRRILFDLARAAGELEQAAPSLGATEAVQRSYTNLLRLWADAPAASQPGGRH
jgi:PKHD-type hydroxylase